MDHPVDDCLGGAPANVACGLARLGTPVVFAGRLGQDAIGEAFSRLFADRGVDTTLLQRDAERPSRIVLVRRSSDGERQFQGFAGDEGAGFADQALEPATLTQARWLLIGTLPLASPASAAALLSAVRQARSQGTAMALDVNWRPTFWDATADPESGPSAASDVYKRQACLQSVVSTPRSCRGMPSVPVASCWSVVRWRVNASFRGLTGIRGPVSPIRLWSRLGCLRPDGC